MKLCLTFLLLCWATSLNAATVFYLHGKIVEDRGDNAVHPRYGTYQYGRIISKLEDSGHTVLSQIRPKSTDRAEYAAKVSNEIRSLIRGGTAPEDIVVIGFSKGAQIALLVSEQLANKHIRFVFQAVCGRWIEQYKDLRVHGTILSQYETSDGAGSCEVLLQRSNVAACEISISTGQEHGAFYQPLDEWYLPLTTWIDNGSVACEAFYMP